MKKAKHSEEKIIGAVKQMEAGRTAAELAREVGVSQHTIYAWKAKFGGMESSDALKLRHLEDENGRLKKLVACGILERKPIAEEARRHEYVLTEMGEDLLTTIIALRQWGDRWLFRPSPPPIEMFDAVDGSELEQLIVHSSRGREVLRADVRLRRRPQQKSSSRPARRRSH